MDVPEKMRAMVLEKQGEELKLQEVTVPKPGDSQVLVQVHACGVCHTDLHIVDQELTEPKLPLIPGHEIVGTVAQTGKNVKTFKEGDRVGIPWLGHTCGKCKFCQRGQENLCDNARFTGYTSDGGYAEFTVADEQYCFAIPDLYEDVEAAPLLCAGLIGYRTYRMTGEHVKNLGIYGFGAAAHIIAQIANYQGKQIYAFTRPGDSEGQSFAKRLGAVWADGSDKIPPVELDAAMIFAPVGALIPAALKATIKGGTVVSGGIHMSEIPSFAYKHLWEERVIKSVANLTRQDGEELFEIAPKVPVKTEVHPMPLEKANDALNQLRAGEFEGAAVLKM